MMEVYAAALAHADHQIGRVIDAIDETGELDNTLVIYIQGDNGASAEGSPQGLLNEMTFFNAIPEELQRGAPPHGRARRTDDIQPLPGRLGACDGHAVPVDQADRLAISAARATAW